MHVRVFMPEVNVGIFLSCSLSFKTKSLTEYEAHIFEWESRNTQSHWDGHLISADPGIVKRKNKRGAMTTAAKNACLHKHTVLSHSMGQQDWETSEHLTNS